MYHVNANGANIPALGFGTFRIPEDDVRRILPEALKLGFRHVDTAQIYKNEGAVGEVIAQSGISRHDIFLTTKVWVDRYRHDDFLASVDESLQKLKTDYVDLLLLHWPKSDVPLAERIGALNEVRKAGKVRNIGISNFNVALTEEAVKLSDTPLATNQIEYHPYLNQTKVISAARKNGLSVTAYYLMADGRGAERSGAAGYWRKARQDGGTGDPALGRAAAGCRCAFQDRDGKPPEGEFRHFRFCAHGRGNAGDPRACQTERPHRQPRPPRA